MTKQYTVPTVAQTSNNTCWHASALMLWYYWQGETNKQGPMNTLANNYTKDLPITPTQFVDLASKVGLKKVVGQATPYFSTDLVFLLNLYGPLWSAGYWFGPGHIIVLTGVINDTIYFNDPDQGVRKQNTVAWFNSKLAKTVDGCLMYKDPAAY
jgi:ABC-type bacteriocin/lantibiotic exporter with double-glycine peptidase domain